MPSSEVSYPGSWYPICLSGELARGELKLVELFGRAWVLFRGRSGRVGLIERHCQHMGTDLAKGRVVEDSVQCPFHLWRYSPEGLCKVKTSERSYELGSTRFTCRESEGVIFAFPGAVPLFDFPAYPRATAPIAGYVVTRLLDTPYEALIFNGFDSHHLECIHHRVITEPVRLSRSGSFLFHGDFAMKVLVKTFYDRMVSWLGSKVQRFGLDCWGGNHLIITNERTRDNIVITSVPFAENRSRIFIYAVTQDRGSWIANALARLRLSVTAVLAAQFLGPDIRIVEDMRPARRRLIPELDRSIEEFWAYWDGIPKVKLEP